jgi:hypothetical protein
LDRAVEQSQAWIEKGGIDSVSVHVGDALVWIEAAGLSFGIFERVRRNNSLPRADRPNPTDAALLLGVGLPLIDYQSFRPAVIFDDARCALTESRLHVSRPKVERLKDMSVRINDIVGTCHHQLQRVDLRTILKICSR